MKGYSLKQELYKVGYTFRCFSNCQMFMEGILSMQEKRLLIKISLISSKTWIPLDLILLFLEVKVDSVEILKAKGQKNLNMPISINAKIYKEEKLLTSKIKKC